MLPLRQPCALLVTRLHVHSRVNDEKIVSKLLGKKSSELTFDKAVEEAVKIEANRAAAQRIEQRKSKSVHMVNEDNLVLVTWLNEMKVKRRRPLDRNIHA